MVIYKGKTQSYMTCTYGFHNEILYKSRLRNNIDNWYAITKENSNLLYMLDKCKNWKVAE